MTTLNRAVGVLHNMRDLFERTASCLDEADSDFRPKPEMMSVAEQVAHTAQTIDWFVEGAFRPEGFDTDFEGHLAKVREVSSLAAAREWWSRAVDSAIETIGAKTDAELNEPLPEGIMGGMPKRAILHGMADHTAHHRGSLAVYARMLGKVPPVPYV